MLPRMRYRLALDIGTTSIGWCMIRLNAQDEPCAVIRAGVRIFSDGREPARGKGEVGTSLAATRRAARAARRRRDRLLKRKGRLVEALVRLGFWTDAEMPRKALAALDPYLLRARGLEHLLTPAEFGRALFHLNQRRGFLSNRKTDKKDNDSGLLTSAIRQVREQLASDGVQTIGQWLAKRHERRESVRGRLRGKTARDRAYDLYIDRAMIAHEFDTLWAKQSELNPAFYSEDKRAQLRDILLFQRPLRPVLPGRCTLLPDEPRAPLALPSTQRFRIYQEVNNLRFVGDDLREQPLTLAQRDAIAGLLERGDAKFTRMLKALKLPGTTKFNLQDVKRDALKGNATAKELSKEGLFGPAWFSFEPAMQDEIVSRLLDEADEDKLIAWLKERTGISKEQAVQVASAGLAEGYGSLSRAALARVLPQLQREVMPYSEAVTRAGFESHSALSAAEQTEEVRDALPYYGEALQRHVGFADPRARDNDPPEKQFGRIANPTVHIGLNELRKVVNKLIGRYGHPSEVIVEIARELKQGREQRQREHELQAERQSQNEQFREKIRSLPGYADRQVTAQDLQLMRLWVELNPQDAASRRCPYTGEVIGPTMLFSEKVEIEHILPFSQTLDDSLNNKTVALRRANREKGNRTPYEAFGHNPEGYDYEAILQRAALMSKEKAKRFAPDGYERWLKEDNDFLARALTDTAYLSRIAREYLSLICPANRVRVIPGRLTAMLRGKFGLNGVLGLDGEKNRDDHRHHAVDAAVIGVTDQGLLQKFARASASAREQSLGRLVETIPLPWPSYAEHVRRAVHSIIVSHKPDHGHEGALHNDTAYGLNNGRDGFVTHRVMLDSFKSAEDIAKKEFADETLKTWLLEQTAGLSGKEFAARIEALRREHGVRRVKLAEKLSVIEMHESEANDRHGIDDNGRPRPYKGYKGDSNYCIEIWRNEKGKWEADVISTFLAHQIVRSQGGAASGRHRLRHPTLALNDRPLVMRLMANDFVRLDVDGSRRTMRVAKISANGQVFMAEHSEANVDARNRDKTSGFKYVSKMAGSFQSVRARQVFVSEIGDLRDPGFEE